MEVFQITQTDINASLIFDNVLMLIEKLSEFE